MAATLPPKKQAMLDMRADYVIAPEFYGSNFLVD